MPAILEAFVEDPAAGVAAVADLLRAYWDRALAPHWPRMRALLEGDVLHRARQMADGGAERLFADVDPTVSWADGVLSIDKRAQQDVDLEERGLLFVPSVFTWPDVVLVTDPEVAADDRLSGARRRARCGTPGARRRPTPSARCSGSVRAGRADGAGPAALDDRPGATRSASPPAGSPST